MSSNQNNNTITSSFLTSGGEYAEYSDMTVEDIMQELGGRSLDESGDKAALLARLREAVSYEEDAREVAASMGVVPIRPSHEKHFNMFLIHAVQVYIELWKEKCPNARPPKGLYKHSVEYAVEAAQRLVRGLANRGDDENDECWWGECK